MKVWRVPLAGQPLLTAEVWCRGEWGTWDRGDAADGRGTRAQIGAFFQAECGCNMLSMKFKWTRPRVFAWTLIPLAIAFEEVHRLAHSQHPSVLSFLLVAVLVYVVARPVNKSMHKWMLEWVERYRASHPKVSD